MDSDLVDRLLEAKQLLADDADNVIVFGSAAISLRGVELGRVPDDIDFFVSEAVFAQLEKKFPVKLKPAGEGGFVAFLEPAEKIEILKSFPGVEFDAVSTNASAVDRSEGFRVGTLNDLRSWKLAQGRPKDMKDIEVIDQYISREK